MTQGLIVGTGSANIDDVEGAYATTFANLRNGTCYQNGLTGLKALDNPTLKSYWDKLSQRAVQQKAMQTTTGGAGTAGYALVQVFLDQRMIDSSRKQTPAVVLLPRVTNMGMNCEWDVISAKGTAYALPENAAIPASDETITRKSQRIKFIYVKGEVSGPAQAAIAPFTLEGFTPSSGGVMGYAPFGNQSAPNAMQLKAQVAARLIKEKEEDLFFNGDSSATPAEFDGFLVQQSTTNGTNLSSAAMAYDDIEEIGRVAYANGGSPNVAFGSSKVVKDVRIMMIDVQRHRPADLVGGNMMPFGIPQAITLWTMDGPIPLIPSRFLSDTTGSKRLIFMDTNYIELRILQDLTYEEKPNEKDGRAFLLKMYETLAVRAPTYNSHLYGIA